jgi:hypothetical protein
VKTISSLPTLSRTTQFISIVTLILSFHQNQIYTLLFEINISELEFDHFASDVIRAMIQFEPKKRMALKQVLNSFYDTSKTASPGKAAIAYRG